MPAWRMRFDNHWGMLFKAAILSTLLSVGSEAGTSENENSFVQAIRQGGSQSFNQVGQQVVGRSLNNATDHHDPARLSGARAW